MTTSSMSPGTIAAFGTLEIALLATPPSFKVGDRVVTRHRIVAPGAAIGRSEEADVTIQGDPDRVKTISGWHLFLQLGPLGWTIRDDSTNGTSVRTDGGTPVRLNPNQPIRIEDGMVVELPSQIAFRITKIGPAGSGTVLDGGGAAAPEGVWLANPQLAELLEVLVAPYRDGGTLPTFNVDYVCERLGWGKTLAHKRRTELADHPSIRPLLPNPSRVKFPELAAAAAQAFPQMVSMPRR